MADGGGGGGGGKADGAAAAIAREEEDGQTSAVQQYKYYSTAHHQDRQLTIVRREADWGPSLSDINWTDKYMGDLELLREQVLNGAVTLPAAGVCIWGGAGDAASPDGETGHYYMVQDREAKASVVLSGWLTKNPAVKNGLAAAAVSGLRRFMDHFKRSKERWFVMSKATTACPATLTYFKDETMSDLKGSFVLDHSWHVDEVPDDVLTFTLYNGDLGVNLVAKKIRDKKAWLQVLRAAVKVARQAYTHRLYKQSRFALVFQLSTRVGGSPTAELSRQLRATLQRNQLNLDTNNLIARAMVCSTCKGPFARRRKSLWGAKGNVSRHFCVFCNVVMCNECSYIAPDIAQFDDDDEAGAGGTDDVNQICRACNFLWNVLPRDELQAVLDLERESEQAAIRQHQEKKRIELAMQEQLEMQNRSNAAYEQALSAMQRATEEQMEMLDNSNLDGNGSRDRADTKEQQEQDISTIMEREMSMYPDDLKELFASFDHGVGPGPGPGGYGGQGGSSAPGSQTNTPSHGRSPAVSPAGGGADGGADRARHSGAAGSGEAAGTGKSAASVRRRSHEHEKGPPLDDSATTLGLASTPASASGTPLSRQRSRSGSRHDVLGEMGREIFGSPGQEPTSSTPSLVPQDLPRHLHHVVDGALKQQKLAEAQKEKTRQRILEARLKREASRERRERERELDRSRDREPPGSSNRPEGEDRSDDSDAEAAAARKKDWGSTPGIMSHTHTSRAKIRAPKSDGDSTLSPFPSDAASDSEGCDRMHSTPAGRVRKPTICTKLSSGSRGDEVDSAGPGAPGSVSSEPVRHPRKAKAASVKKTKPHVGGETAGGEGTGSGTKKKKKKKAKAMDTHSGSGVVEGGAAADTKPARATGATPTTPTGSEDDTNGGAWGSEGSSRPGEKASSGKKKKTASGKTKSSKTTSSASKSSSKASKARSTAGGGDGDEEGEVAAGSGKKKKKAKSTAAKVKSSSSSTSSSSRNSSSGIANGGEKRAKKASSSSKKTKKKAASGSSAQASPGVGAPISDSTASTLAKLAMLERRLHSSTHEDDSDGDALLPPPSGPSGHTALVEGSGALLRRMSSEKVLAAAQKAAETKKKKKKKKKLQAEEEEDARDGSAAKKTASSSATKKKKKKKKKPPSALDSGAAAGTGYTAADLEDGLPVRVFRENGVVLLGTVRYVGPTEFFKGDWVGVELDNKQGGLNDGAVQGVRYFTCPGKAGIFVRPEAVQPLVL